MSDRVEPRVTVVGGSFPASLTAVDEAAASQPRSPGPTADIRDTLLALYAAVDAEGGAESDEGPEYHAGFSHGLELALTHIDQMLNVEPDHAWIEEGWKRFSARLASTETK